MICLSDISEKINRLSTVEIKALKEKLKEKGFQINHNNEIVEIIEFEKKIKLISKQEDYEISCAQRRLWVLNQLEVDSIAYNIPSSFFLAGEFNKKAFKKAYAFIIERHESLRTVFVTENGEPRQNVLENPGYNIEFIDLRNDKNAEKTARELGKKDILTPFNLEKGPLVRFNLLRMEDEKYLILFNMHHIISDGWSMEIFTREFLSFYNSFNENKIPDIESLRIHYKDYSAWQNALLESSDMDNQRLYWLEKLSGDIPVLNLPTDKVRPAVQTYHGKSVGFHLSEEVKSELTKLCKENHISLFMMLQALVKILFYRYTGQEDIILGSPIAGRVHEDLENQIGFYVNTLVFRDIIKNDLTFTEILDSVKQTCTEAFDHQDYPFDRLVDDLDLKRDLSRSPLFDVMLVLQNNEETIDEVDNIEFSSYATENVISKFDITFNFMEGNNDLYGGIEYNTDIYADDRILRMIEHLKTLVTSIINNPETKIKDLEIIPETEKNLLLNVFNDTYVDYPKDKTIVDLFEEQVQKTSDNIAIVFENIELTYKELNQKSNIVAHYLREHYEIKPDDLIGVLLDRSEKMIIALLGILKSGAAYIPIDPEYPQERINYMFEDSKPKVVLSERKGISTNNIEIINIKEVLKTCKSVENPEIKSGPNNLAYVIYTSGSTGKPKGVSLENKGICNVLEFIEKTYPLQCEDRYLLKTNYSFDVSVTELFGWVFGKGQLVILPKNYEKDPKYIANIINKKNITHINFVPSMLNNFLDNIDDKESKFKSLKYIFVAGELFSSIMIQKLNNLNDSVSIENIYGPTESTIYSSNFSLLKKHKYSLIPIGKPISNTQLYIVDKDNKLLPIGSPGELCISGAGLARGYLNKPELTNEKFIKNPFKPGERMYLTGDLARWLPDGNIEYLGRMDHQVKIRGFRIELGEIENSLLQNEFINSVVVVDNEHTNGGKELVSYYVSNKELKISELRSFLSKSLPDYMIPSWFVNMESLPLTSNGKIDRKALPDPEVAGISTGNEYIAPGNDIEKLLVSVWQDVMGSRNNIGIDDNFFELGGDSIKAIQVMARLSQEGLKGEIASLFSSPTIREFSLLVKKSIKKIDQSSVEGELPLTPIQNWFFNDFKCEKHHFNQAVMLNFKESIDVEKLKLLKESAKGLINHHDALRMRYRQIDGNVIQENRSESELYFKEYDVSEDENHEQKINEIANRVQNSFNLEDDTLIKFVFFKLKEGCRLLIVAHHLIIDGVSWRILVNDLESSYRQRFENKKIILPLKTTSFKDWSYKLTEYAASTDFKKEALFWKEQNSRKNDRLPAARLNKNNEKAYSTISLNKETTETLLTKTNQAFNTGINDILLASLTRAISRWCGNTKISIDLESHGRSERFDDIDISRTIGWFTSIYPVVLDIKNCDHLGDGIINVKEQLSLIPDNGIGYGIYKYLTEYNDNPKYESEILFNYLGQFDEDLDTGLFGMASESTGESVSSQASSSYKLNFNGVVALNEFFMTLDSDVYDKETLDEIQTIFKEELLRTISYYKNRVNLFDKIKINKIKVKNKEIEGIYI